MTLPFDIEEAVAHISAVDDTMADAIARIGDCEMTLLSFDRPCESVTRSIVFQAISMKAARKIYERISHELGDTFDHDDILARDVETFRELGLSTSKANAILGVAESMKAGAIPSDVDDYSEMTNQEIIDVYTQVKGIGVWTVQMILMFRLGRPDVMPDGDLGVREGFRIVYDLEDRPTPKTVRDATVDWSPFRTVGAWYLWRAVDEVAGGEW